MALGCLLFLSTLAWTQDSPGRFEAGGSFSAIRLGGGQFGPGADAGFNITRHIALDGSFSWLPTIPAQGTVITGLFGVKAGVRNQRFGYFAKVRPGFIMFGRELRDETVFFDPATGLNPVARTGRQTEKALDYGGVMEFYPAHHWTLRWDAGDTVLFRERGPTITLVNNGIATQIFTNPPRTTHQFQFSTGIRYRF
jgi:hypothetical protein